MAIRSQVSLQTLPKRSTIYQGLQSTPVHCTMVFPLHSFVPGTLPLTACKGILSSVVLFQDQFGALMDTLKETRLV